MNNKGLFKSIILVLLGLILVSCSKELPPGEYDANEIGKIKKVIPGTIISMRKVNLHKQAQEAVAGHTKVGSDSLMEGGYNQTRGVEYVIKLNSGGIISVVQAEDLKLKNKQKILVIYGRNTRVVADNGSDVY
jgi:outer membrane lipoprotein SlyB